MSVLSTFPAMPNRMAIACEYLSSFGADGAPKDDVLKQLSPFSNDDGGETTGGGTTMSSSVVSEMENLELVSINAMGNLSLTDEVLPGKSERRDWQTFLRVILRERLTDPNRSIQCKQEDVGDALAWLLTQDPFNPIAKSRRHADLLREQLSDGDILLTTIGNDARFQNLLYWARYTGFAEWLSHAGADVILPDPTLAVSEFLPAVFEAQKTLAIGEFASRLAKICSIFEGGSIRQAFEQRSKTATREQHHFARSTSLCLVRLENRGIISLGKEADAETWILDLAKEQKPVTSINYLSKVKT